MAELNIGPDEKVAGVPLARLLRNLEETSYNEGALDLACRLTDCKAVIEELLAGRATPPSPSTAEDELLPLPSHYFCLNSMPVMEGYTAAQIRAYGRECARAAVEKERIERRPRVKLDPELKAALEEAAKTRSTVALLPDGEPVFINYGDQPEDTAHLSCTACGGSGHIDDQNDIAFSAALSANAADREAKEKA